MKSDKAGDSISCVHVSVLEPAFVTSTCGSLRNVQWPAGQLACNWGRAASPAWQYQAASAWPGHRHRASGSCFASLCASGAAVQARTAKLCQNHYAFLYRKMHDRKLKRWTVSKQDMQQVLMAAQIIFQRPDMQAAYAEAPGLTSHASTSVVMRCLPDSDAVPCGNPSQGRGTAGGCPQGKPQSCTRPFCAGPPAVVPCRGVGASVPLVRCRPGGPCATTTVPPSASASDCSLPAWQCCIKQFSRSRLVSQIPTCSASAEHGHWPSCMHGAALCRQVGRTCARAGRIARPRQQGWGWTAPCPSPRLYSLLARYPHRPQAAPVLGPTENCITQPRHHQHVAIGCMT